MLFAPIAQSVEHLFCNQVVAGSIPVGGSHSPVAQVVERWPYKPGVMSSTLVGGT